MECAYCGKILITSPKFNNENEWVECSNCKNTFKFIRENTAHKHYDDRGAAEKNAAINLLFRLLIAVMAIILFYFLNSQSAIEYRMVWFILVNTLPLIGAVVYYYATASRLLNYSDLFNDMYIATETFTLILIDIIATVVLNLIFFIIY